MFNGRALVTRGRAADERDAVVIRVDPHEDHAARHHRRRIPIADLKTEHLGVEAHGRLEVGDVEHDMAELSKGEGRGGL